MLWRKTRPEMLRTCSGEPASNPEQMQPVADHLRQKTLRPKAVDQCVHRQTVDQQMLQRQRKAAAPRHRIDLAAAFPLEMMAMQFQRLREPHGVEASTDETQQLRQVVLRHSAVLPDARPCEYPTRARSGGRMA